MSDMNWCIVSCSADCEAILRSSFSPKSKSDLGGLARFAAELASELSIDAEEISSTEIARAWARAYGWSETPDGWYCPAHTDKENKHDAASTHPE